MINNQIKILVMYDYHYNITMHKVHTIDPWTLPKQTMANDS